MPEASFNIVLLSSREIEGYTCVLHKGYSFTKEDFYSQGVKRIDMVIHVGAFSPKDGKQMNKIEGNTNNILNTKWLLDNIPNIPERFVYCSTISVYGRFDCKINEDIIPRPNTLYGISKLYCEKLVEVWAKENNVSFGIVRFGTVYGVGEEQRRHLIPLAIKKAIKSEPLEVYTDGSELKTYINVKDCCKLVMKYAMNYSCCEIINLTGDKPISVLDLLNMINEVAANPNELVILNNPNVYDDELFEPTKMRKLLNGDSLVDIKTGIIEELEYMREI